MNHIEVFFDDLLSPVRFLLIEFLLKLQDLVINLLGTINVEPLRDLLIFPFTFIYNICHILFFELSQKIQFEFFLANIEVVQDLFFGACCTLCKRLEKIVDNDDVVVEILI